MDVVSSNSKGVNALLLVLLMDAGKSSSGASYGPQSATNLISKGNGPESAMSHNTGSRLQWK